MKSIWFPAALVVLAVACDNLSDSPTGVGYAPGTTFSSGTADVDVCQNTNVGATGFFHFYRPRWSCGRNVSVGSPDGSVAASDIQEAIARWNEVLIHPRADTVFRFSYSASDPLVVVKSMGGFVCGAHVPGDTTATNPDVITLTSGCPDPAVNVVDLLTHELGHAVGFDSNADGNRIPGFNEHCTMTLPNPTGSAEINGDPCQREIEVIYEGYEMREMLPVDWDHSHFVTGLNISPNAVDSLDIDKDTLLTLVGLVHLRGNENASNSLGTTLFAWSSVDPFIASVAGMGLTGLVTAKLDGTTDIITEPTNALPSNPSKHIAGANFGQKGHPTSVTVPECTGTPRVTAITADEQPAITTPGTHWFTATIVGCADAYEWTFIPSLPLLPGDTVSTTTGTASFNVQNGDYTLYVTATPFRGGDPGFHLIQSINVCADNGGLPVYGGPGLPGDPGPNRVEGC